MIEVENLSKTYGDSRVVSDVSFHVERGEILGFLGPNGAGKTTTMRILTCFMAPTGGTARIAGHDILESSLEVRRNIGYLPENVPLYLDMSVRDYLSYVSALRSVPKNKRAERLEAALDAGKLEDRADTLIRKLSKGYRQRVGIAQAVIHDPPVLILDEPSAGLDPRQRVETRRFIKSLARDHTIILSTHILPDVQETCSRVVIINKGRLVAEDAPENLDKRIGGSDHLSLVLKTPAPDAASQLEGLPGILKARRNDSLRSDSQSTARGEIEFSVDVEPEVDAREGVARLCVQQNWGLLELRRARRTLEDVFLELTTSDERLEGME
ncbi:MAG: gliding motility-associated transport system ATP-binding protein [Abditibacteriota bacterium]|nr:gliding motility-associated transport system ATP-binding protein [Abditibacteriota bacterium]